MDQQPRRSRRRAPRPIVGIAAIGLAVPATPVLGQNVEGLDAAVAYYHEHATSDLEHMHRATHQLEAVAIRHGAFADSTDGPHDSWLAAYWTSFAYTQLGLFARDDRSPWFTRLALEYLEVAKASRPDSGSATDADLLALEGHVMNFMRGTDADRADEYRARAEAALQAAEEADPDNPMVWMNRGLSLIVDPETRGAAYDTLERAIELYEPRMGTSRPNWGREFIDVWMGRYPPLG